MILIAGCGANKRPLATTVNTLDSIRVDRQVVLRDTLVKLPYYKIGVSVAQDKLTEDPVTRTNGNAKVELYKKDDIIYANAVCDSLELKLQLKDELIETYRLQLKDTTITLPPEQIKYVPWYIKALAWIGGIFSLYAVVRIIYTIYKPKFI